MDQFILGFAGGVALLTLLAYRRVSPPWLRWLLIATGALMIARYVTMARLPDDEALQPMGALRWLWVAGAVGLTLPSVFAVDQMVRHPAMTPKKLLRWYAPLLVLYGASLLAPGRPWMAPAVTGLFVLALLWVCGLLARQLPDGRIRRALLGLSLASCVFAGAGLVVAFGHGRLPLLLATEMLTLLALWYAYDLHV